MGRRGRRGWEQALSSARPAQSQPLLTPLRTSSMTPERVSSRGQNCPTPEPETGARTVGRQGTPLRGRSRRVPCSSAAGSLRRRLIFQPDMTFGFVPKLRRSSDPLCVQVGAAPSLTPGALAR